jgi:hypothetical protein
MWYCMYVHYFISNQSKVCITQTLLKDVVCIHSFILLSSREKGKMMYTCMHKSIPGIYRISYIKVVCMQEYVHTFQQLSGVMEQHLSP